MGPKTITLPDRTWYCWVPLLRDQLTFTEIDDSEREKYQEHIFPRVTSDTDETQEVDGELYWKDNTNQLIGLKIYIPEDGEVEVSCNVSVTGLTSFEFTKVEFLDDLNDESQEIVMYDMLPVCVFDVIRDAYHQHIHHDRGDECQLYPVVSEDDVSGSFQVYKEYRDKITYYHKQIQFFEESPKKFKAITLMQKQVKWLDTARGEYVFADSFIRLHCNHLCDKINVENALSSFENASKSIYILREKYSWRGTYRVTIIALIIMIIQFVIGLSAIPAAIQSIKNLVGRTQTEASQDGSK